MMDSISGEENNENPTGYLMENNEEIRRLELKTDADRIRSQARWAGLKHGMRVADVGCGPGKTTAVLQRLTGEDGTCVGIDFSEDRIQHATSRYGDSKISFQCRNILDPLDDLGEFDFVIMRFILEYFRSKAFDIVQNVAQIVKHGGILCLIDLDHNCLNHYGLPSRLQRAITTIMDKLSSDADFDPHMGIKLYAMLYDLCFESIDVTMSAHHMIFGELDYIQDYNWTKKIEIAAKHCGYDFEEYEDGYEGFYAEFKSSFSDPRRFLYTPLICCRGVRSV